MISLKRLKQMTPIRAALWRIGLLSDETQTSVAERACIAKHAATCMRLAEIGVYNGVTTAVIRGVMSPEAVFWAIDPFEAGRFGFNIDESIARSNVEKVANGQIEFVKMTGVAASQHWREHFGECSLDFLFVDAEHTWDGIKGDWESWSGLIAVGGVVCLHDSRSTPDLPLSLDSVRFTQEVVWQDRSFQLIDEVDSLSAFRRIAACQEA